MGKDDAWGNELRLGIDVDEGGPDAGAWYLAERAAGILSECPYG